MARKPNKGLSKTSGDALEALQEGEDQDLRALARAHTERSLQTLVNAQTARKAPWSARIAAAKHVLELGHDRAAVRDPEERNAGLRIVINQFSTGDSHSRAVDGVQTAREVAEALDELRGWSGREPESEDEAAPVEVNSRPEE